MNRTRQGEETEDKRSYSYDSTYRGLPYFANPETESNYKCRGSWRNIGLWGDNKAAAEHQLVMAAQFCECPENHSIAHFELRRKMSHKGPSVKICFVTSLWWYWEVMAGPSERKWGNQRWPGRWHWGPCASFPPAPEATWKAYDHGQEPLKHKLLKLPSE